MKRVFIDTNVFIDYLGQRGTFFGPAAKIVSLADRGLIRLIVSSLSFATGSYVLEAHCHKTAEEIVEGYRQFVTICGIATVDEATILAAIRHPFDDFEDAIQYHASIAENADCIVTRNKSDFTLTKIPVMEPQEFLDMLAE